MGGKAITTEEFIKKAQAIWGDKFDYSKVNYINKTTPVEIICNRHNISFWQIPRLHYHENGCKECAKECRCQNYVAKKIGEQFKNTKGYRMTIVGGENYKDLTVQFDNGVIKEHIPYGEIKRGSVLHPSPHLHETNISSRGQTMKIIRDNGYFDIDVQFEDGAVVKHRTYQEFQSGQISNPNFPNIRMSSFPEIVLLYYLSQIGFRKAPKHSLAELGAYELDAYNPNVNGHKVAVEYDGYPWHLDPEHDIGKNIVCTQNGIKLYRIRELGLPPLGKNVTEYLLTARHRNDIDTIYTIVSNVVKLINRDCGTSFSIVKTPEDKDNIFEIMNSYYCAHRKARLGQTNVMNNGIKATIIEYRKYNDIDVQFETGEIIKNTVYSCFQAGSISLPNTNTNLLKMKHLKEGAKYQSDVYGEMTITRYNGHEDIDVECSNGKQFHNISTRKLYYMCRTIETRANYHAVILTDKTGKKNNFSTIKAAATSINVSSSSINRALKGSGYCKGYKIENAT